MQFVIKARDGENTLEKRREVRSEHLENLSKFEGKNLCSGALLDGEGNMKGSMLVLEAESMAQIDAYLAGEPYLREGVWETVEVERMHVVFLNGEKVGA